MYTRSDLVGRMTKRFGGIAADNGLLIVSKDSDFHGWSTLYGFPPKVIWLWTGNCSTEKIASLLQFNAAFIAEFENNESDSLLVLH